VAEQQLRIGRGKRAGFCAVSRVAELLFARTLVSRGMDGYAAAAAAAL
jgi:hypothetical protein